MSGRTQSLEELSAELTAPGGPFEIHDVDVDGVAIREWRGAPANAVDILRASAAYGEREFVVHEGQRLSFAAHFRQAATMATRLIEHDLAAGDRVAIAARNLPQVVVTFWGALAAGAVLAPLNAWWTSEELAAGLNDSGATVLVLDEERLARLRKQFDHLSQLRHIVVISDDPAHPADLGKPHERIALHRYQDFLGGTDREDLPDVAVDADQDAAIFYNSGTVAKAKPAVVTHRNLCSAVVSLAYAKALREQLAGRPASREITLVNIPLFHVTGAVAGLVSHTASGGTLVTMRHFDAGRALKLIERERVTSIGGVPTIVQQLLAHPDLGRHDLSSVLWVSYGGAAAPDDLPGRIRAALPRAVASNAYGLTETTALVTQISGQEYLEHPTSVGRVVPVCEVAIVPESFDGHEPSPADCCPRGEAGQIWIKGPNVVRGYWRRPQATSQFFSRGWVRTGDIGRLDEGGRLYIVERSRDMIIHRGHTIYPSIIEGQLCHHPAVAECAVVGLPDESVGEEVVAVVVLREEGLASEGELRDFLRGRVEEIALPARVVVRPFALPRNAQLKVLKRELRESLTGEAH